MDEELPEARFIFDPEAIRAASAPPDTAVRLIWAVLELVRKKEVSFTRFFHHFQLGIRTFSRDIAQLRSLGEQFGFTLSPRRKGIVRLRSADGIAFERQAAGHEPAELIHALVDALGAVVGNELAGFVDTGNATLDPFLRLALPKLKMQSEVATTFEILRAHWRKRARVRFRYPRSSTDVSLEERTIEPHLVTFYDGRYYLVGYDRRPQTADWRQFALDRISGPIASGGSFSPRAVPRHYQGIDAIGLFKADRKPHAVTVEISPYVADAVFARTWQRAQRIGRGSSAWDTITLEVYDLAEAVRWSLAFGSEARIVSPDAAVELARMTIAQIATAYARDASTRDPANDDRRFA